MAESSQPPDATTALAVADSVVVVSPHDAMVGKRGCPGSTSSKEQEDVAAAKERELVAAKKIRTDKQQEEKESGPTEHHSGHGSAPAGSATRPTHEEASLEREYEEEEEEEEEESFDFSKHIVGRDDWLENAKKAITGIGKLSSAVSLSIFYEDELEGSMPDETVNMTRGMLGEDIVRGIVIGLHDDVDSQSEGTTGKITGLQIGVAGGGIPGTSFGEVDTAKEAVDWLLREGGGGDEDKSKRADLFIRLWPWNIHEGDDWVEYSENCNDLEKVGLLQGPWYDDCQKVVRQDLERLVQGLFDTLEASIMKAKK